MRFRAMANVRSDALLGDDSLSKCNGIRARAAQTVADIAAFSGDSMSCDPVLEFAAGRILRTRVFFLAAAPPTGDESGERQ